MKGNESASKSKLVCLTQVHIVLYPILFSLEIFCVRQCHSSKIFTCEYHLKIFDASNSIISCGNKNNLCISALQGRCSKGCNSFHLAYSLCDISLLRASHGFHLDRLSLWIICVYFMLRQFLVPTLLCQRWSQMPSLLGELRLQHFRLLCQRGLPSKGTKSSTSKQAMEKCTVSLVMKEL